MKHAIFDRIKDKGNQLSPKQVQLAEYLINNYKSAAFETIARISKKAGVSEATVVRMADTLDYSSFSEMLEDLQLVVRHELEAFEHIRYTYKGDALKKLNILEEVVNNEQKNLVKLLENTSIDEISRVVDSIIGADTIVVIGLYAESYFAQYFSYNLGKIRRNVINISRDNADVFNVLMSCNKKTLGIILSFPRYLHKTLELGEILQKKGVTVVGISDSVSSPLRAVSNPLLVVPQDYISFSDPGCAVLLLLQAIIMQYISRNPGRTEEHLQEFDRNARRLNVMT